MATSRETLRRPESAGPDRAARAPARGATWLVFVAAFALGGAGGYLAGRATPPGPDGATAAASASEGVAELPAAALPERMLALEPFVVNLLGDDASRYLKVRVELEAATPEMRGELETRLPQVRDGVLTVLGTRDLAQVTSFEGRAVLKRDIEERVNGLLGEGQIRSVLFTEFVVQ